MSQGHTPGPWKADSDPEHDDGETWAVWTDTGGGCEAELAGRICVEANARLMAAAPDLLAALKDVYALLDSGVLVRDVSRDHEPGWAMKALDLTLKIKRGADAIAKATGEPR